MDKLLKLKILETEPKEPEDEQIYRHWLKTFQCFPTSAQATRRNADNEPQLNKLSLLFNYCMFHIEFTYTLKKVLITKMRNKC